MSVERIKAVGEKIGIRDTIQQWAPSDIKDQFNSIIKHVYRFKKFPFETLNEYASALVRGCTPLSVHEHDWFVASCHIEYHLSNWLRAEIRDARIAGDGWPPEEFKSISRVPFGTAEANDLHFNFKAAKLTLGTMPMEMARFWKIQEVCSKAILGAGGDGNDSPITYARIAAKMRSEIDSHPAWKQKEWTRRIVNLYPHLSDNEIRKRIIPLIAVGEYSYISRPGAPKKDNRR